MKNPYKVYALYDINDSTQEIRYVGITEQTIEERIYEHKRDCRRTANKTHKKNWLKKLLDSGSDVGYVFVDDMLTLEEADVQETWWIKYGREVLTFNLVNGTDGGTGWRGKHTEETKKYLSEKAKGRPSAWKGRSPNAETRQKMSLAKEKIKKPVTGYRISDGTYHYFESTSEAFKATGVPTGDIVKVCKGHRNMKQAKGYRWSYTTEIKEKTLD